RPDAALAPARFDAAALRLHALALPPMLRGLASGRTARPVASHTAAAPSLPHRLAALSALDRERTLLDLVRTEVATVLGLADPRSLPIDRPLQELGLDSLMALELRNRLARATGLRLDATLLFDHPTPHALARFLAEQLLGPSGSGRDAAPPALVP